MDKTKLLSIATLIMTLPVVTAIPAAFANTYAVGFTNKSGSKHCQYSLTVVINNGQ